jgi:hypothetical protein
LFFFHSDTNRDNSYHWHRSCELVPEGVQSNPDWMMSNLAPDGRDACSSCSRLDGKPEKKPPAPELKETVPNLHTPNRRGRPNR